MKNYDLIVIGGGSAGMAAALEAKKNGVDSIIILEKDNFLGGILHQCIHNGFGLQEFKEELTGPEYMHRFSDQVIANGIEYSLNSYVTDISRDKVVTFSSKEKGLVSIKGKAIVVATGCYEKGAGAIYLPGDRPSGVITAGTAQKYLNIHGFLCGKRIVILGSGDIGLIMARRLTLEGAKVLVVSEINPYSSGLNRNIAQCLNDFNIPLLLSHTVKQVIGKGRLEKVILSQVDERYNFIPGTEKEYECDTLILSVGLIPYVSLLNNIDCPTSSTKGAIVSENMETEIDGIFTCGNCLHVHDVVDYVTIEGRQAGRGAALYIKDILNKSELVDVKFDRNIGYVVPQKVHSDVSSVNLKFRVRRPMKDVFVVIKNNDKVIKKLFKNAVIPSEMINIEVKIEEPIKDLSVSLEDKNG